MANGVEVEGMDGVMEGLRQRQINASLLIKLIINN